MLGSSSPLEGSQHDPRYDFYVLGTRRHHPWRVRNTGSGSPSASFSRVVITPGGFATWRTPPPGRRLAASSSPLEGSQPDAMAYHGRPDAAVVITPGGFATRPSPASPAPTRVVITPGGFATRVRRAPRRNPGHVVITPGGFATTRRRQPRPAPRPVVITPGGFATRPGPGSRRQWTASSSPLEGSQRGLGGDLTGGQHRRHHPWRVRNASPAPRHGPRRLVVITPGGFAT